MATQVQLNKFVRKSIRPTSTPTVVYNGVPQNASIIISALASNNTGSTQTVNLMLSTYQSSYLPYIVNNFTIPPNDTVNLIVNKLVITENDSIIVSTGIGSDNNIDLTLSILETVNT
jgi:sialic acid synthase SpsE